MSTANVIFLVLILTQSLLIALSVKWTVDPAFDYVFEIPVLLLKPDGQNDVATFYFRLRDTDLHRTTSAFCEQYVVESSMCNNLYEVAVGRKYEFLEHKMINDQLAQNLSTLDVQFIPNPQLERKTIATTAEMDNHFREGNMTMQMEKAVQKSFLGVIHLLEPVLTRNNPFTTAWGDVSSSFSVTNRQQQVQRHQLQLIFIHSCSLPGEENRILLSLLSKLLTSQLLDRRAQVFVLNYGELLQPSTNSPLKIFFNHTAIHFIHVSDRTSFFEIPTLMLMHRLSQKLRDVYHIPLTQFLYLHTKGVSYRTIYPQIEEWREMMLYFLVEKHLMCYHLLASGEIDAVGANFRTSGRDFRGNFWWTTAQYLASLAPLSLLEHGKYDAEQWMLTATHIVRVYNAHESVVDHHVSRYEREQYAPSSSSSLSLSKAARRGSPFSDGSEPLRWLDMQQIPRDRQKLSYCRTKRMSWQQTDDMLAAAVALT